LSEAVTEPGWRELTQWRSRILSLYTSIIVISLVAIGVLLAYIFALGTIVGPGVEQSFGFAVAMLFLLAALLVHIVDRTYREWPLGRRIQPTPPPAVTNVSIAMALRVAVFVGAAAVVAYILAGLLT
jgi:hypothetical protein